MSLHWRLILLLVILCIVYLWKASQLIIAPKRFISPYKPDNFELKYDEINLITNDGIRLKGWFIPASRSGVTPLPTIIICHGYGTDKGDCIDIAQFLHRAGYSIVMFDFRGHGQSDGKYCSLGYYEQEDVKTVIRWLQARGERKIGAIGVSMGGTVALMVQAEEPALLAVVSDGAYLSFHSAVTSFAKKHFKAPKYPFIPPAVWAAGIRLKFNPKELNLTKFMPKIAPKPVLIIHGSEDREIQTQDAYSIFESAMKPKELWVVRGAQHLESHYVARDEYEQKVIKFFDSAFNRN